ncbi:MAG: N-acetylneuraminate synthase family protein [Thermodesulfobacteriota bacterium]
MDQAVIEIKGRLIGQGHKALIAAEVAQAHDGSLGLAHSYIEAAARAGVDAVKFQTHIAAAESTLDEQFRVKFSYQDDTRYDYWQRMEFSPAQWRGLAQHCRDRGLLFLSSPFSLAAAELLEELQVPAWKLASGELDHQPLLEFMAATNKPVIVSSGMSGWGEMERVVGFFRGRGCPLALLQCTSAYPVPLEQVGLNLMEEMGRRFGAPVGLSDHSGSVFPALAALARGAAIIEVHITYHRQMFGPDAAASLTPDELALLVQARDAFFTMSAPLDKDALAADKALLRAQFGRSLALVQDRPAGHRLVAADLTLKKPGGGIPYQDLARLIGKRLARPVQANRLLRREDIED